MRQVDQRRGQNHAFEPALAGMRDTQHDGAAHRVRQRIIGRRAMGNDHVLHEGRNVDLEIGKTHDMPLARIGQLPRRMPLSAPVHDGDREAALPQFAHGLEILFNELAAAGEDADGSLDVFLGIGGRVPARETQRHAVRRLDHARDGTVGTRIAGSGNELHGGTGGGKDAARTRRRPARHRRP